MNDYMDAYCERTGPGLLAEPLNALTNLSFIIAAWAAWNLASRSGRLTPGVWGLVALSFTVGVGSGLWHTFATNWALWLDIVPIFLFLAWFLWMYTRGVAGMATPVALAWVLAYVIGTFAAQRFAQILHGAPVYAPALIAVLALGVVHAQRALNERFTLLIAGGTYLLALLFRTIDHEVCPAFPIGTHFLWHSLIGLVVYLGMRAVIVGLGEITANTPSEPTPVRPSPAAS
jgi:hypothetical protein